ncbi:MAG: arsenate reductase (glutaredoxin) [Hyphomicrobiales bacterium]
MTVTIWHNPRCSKSRRALAILQEKGVDAEVREYQEQAPSVAELKELAELLGKGPGGFIRRGEKLYKELELKGADDATLFAAMAANPILIERPVVFANGKAMLGRPPEDIVEIL